MNAKDVEPNYLFVLGGLLMSIAQLLSLLLDRELMKNQNMLIGKGAYDTMTTNTPLTLAKQDKPGHDRYPETATFKVQFEVKQILKHNPESRFTVLTATKIETKPKQKDLFICGANTFKVTGIFPLVYEKDVFVGTASYRHHDSGPSIHIDGIAELKQPVLEKELIQFLRARVDRLGLKTARDIVRLLGLDCLTQIEKDDHALDPLHLAEKKADLIKSAVREHRQFEALLIFLQKHHLQLHLANPIYERFGQESLYELKRNPYNLMVIRNMPFIHADKLAFELGTDPMHPDRIRYGILAYLEARVQKNCDLCVKEEELYRDLNTFLRVRGGYPREQVITVSKEAMEMAKMSLLQQSLIMTEWDSQTDKEFIYRRHYHALEDAIVDNLTERLARPDNWFAPESEVTRIIQELEAERFPFDPKQRQAVYMALSHGVSILTGGPGTGKTQTTDAIVQTIERLDPNAEVLLFAPTGKAAKRMAQLTSHEAFTIHAGISLHEGGTAVTLKKITAHYVIVDESSMVDALVFESLLKALGPDTRLVLVGDVNQLPSVGPGLILRDLIESKRVPTTRLTTIFRQAQESQIVMNSHAMIHGQAQNITYDKQKGDFFLLEQASQDDIQRTIIRSVERLLTRHSWEELCILTPMRKGKIGLHALNYLMQEKFNPESRVKTEWHHPEGHVFREGDRVIHLENNKELDVSNGEVGTIEEITCEEGAWSMAVAYPDKRDLTVYAEPDFYQLELGYCLTIHKSQGSEFPVVVIPFHSEHENMLTRNLVYTAWTRAKSQVVNIGSKEAIEKAASNPGDIYRLSRIRQKLEESLPELTAYVDESLVTMAA